MTGFGNFDPSCPGRDRHDWTGGETERCCRHCDTVASECMDAATAARSMFFDTLRAPMSAHGSIKRRGPQ